MTKDKILLELMEFKKSKTKKAFANYLGISDQLLGQWFRRPYFDLDTIRAKFPEVSEAWLITGEGEMLKTDQNDEDSGVIASQKVPLIPIHFSKNLELSIQEYTEKYPERLPIYEPSQIYPSFDYMFEVSDNNMSPAINKGDILYIKGISDEDIINGSCYLLDTKKQGMCVFRIQNKGKYLECESVSDIYNNVCINLDDIHNIYKIVGVFSYSVDINETIANLKDTIKKKDELIRQLGSELSNNGKRIDELLKLLNK